MVKKNEDMGGVREIREARKIAFIGQKGIPAEFAGTSGVEFYVEKRALSLVASGKQVTCYVRPWASPGKSRFYGGIRLIRLPTVRTKHFDAPIHALLSTLHAVFSDTDTVWYQASGPALFCFIPRMFGKRVIVTIHALDWKREKWGRLARAVLRLAERVAVRCPHAVLVVSDGLSEYVFRTYNTRPHVDAPSDIRIPVITPSFITGKYGLSGNDYILYMGRFVPEKRIDLLIRAYKKLHPQGVKLVISGGAGQVRKYERDLVQLAKNNPDILFTGWVFGQVKAELLSNCILFVLPSSVEGNPTVLHELPDGVYALVSNVVSGYRTRKGMISVFKSGSVKDLYKQLKIALIGRVRINKT